MSHLKAVMCHLKVVHSESTQKALREHLKSTQRAIRDQESNQTKSYSRSLKYFVLFTRALLHGVGGLCDISVAPRSKSFFFLF